MYSTKLLKLFIAFFSVFIISCSKKDLHSSIDPNVPPGSYANGFFIICEGSYGQNAGTINFYKYDADTVSTRVYEKENPGKILSNSTYTSSLQFASVINSKIYLLSKINGPIVKVDAVTLKEEARYNKENSNWRSILQVNGNEGLVSSNDGVYNIDLNSLQVKNKLTSVAAVNSGDMIKANPYVYILQDNGAKIVSSDNYSFVKGFSGITRGFVQTPNGKVWASTGTRMISFDKNLDTIGIALQVPISSWGLDAPTIITASTKENAVFYHAGAKIYKYIDGNPASVMQPFIIIPESPFMIYGAIRYDSNKDYIVVNGIKGYGAAAGVNFLFIYNASTGTLVKKIQYGNNGEVADFTHISFPNITVFH